MSSSHFTPLSKLPAWLVSGILCGLAHPLWMGVPTGFLMWFALVPLLWDMREPLIFKQYFFKIYPFLLVQGGIFGTFVMFSGFGKWLFSYINQPLLMTLPFLLFYPFLKKLGWRKSMIAFPFVWTVGEWLLHLTPHYFQLASFAPSQISVLWFAQIADIFGMWGITFWLCLVNVSIALTIDKIALNFPKVSNFWKVETLIPPLSIFLKKWAFQGILLFGLPLAYAFWSNLNLPDGQKIKVALVQTNENSYAEVDSAAFEQRIQTVIRLANEAAKTEPDLIVLPESALPLPILSNKSAFSMLRYYVGNWNASLAVGFPDYPDSTNHNQLYNSALVFTPQLAQEWDKLGVPTSELKVYRKQNPLPFMEFMPYVDWFGFKNIVGLNGTEILRGSENHVFTFPDSYGNAIKTSATICWEQQFPETQAALTETGAQFLCQMNNDGWFGNSTGQAFLLNMNRLRAIENRRTIARASNTGISTFIDPYGRLYNTIQTNIETIGTGEVYLNSELTLFTQYKNWFPKLCFIVSVLIFLITFKFKKKCFIHGVLCPFYAFSILLFLLLVVKRVVGLIVQLLVMLHQSE